MITLFATVAVVLTGLSVALNLLSNRMESESEAMSQYRRIEFRHV